MSETDSFINEVSEEVRRDQLYRLMRRYGWIAILLIVLLVGGAAFNEWRKARDMAGAQTLGNEILAALEADDQAALQAIATDGDAAAVLALLQADTEEGRARLSTLAANDAAPAIYRDLAALKLVMAGEGSAAERQAMLEPLASAGAPYRVLAEEQMALIDVETGATDAAIGRLQSLLVDDEATEVLRRRASQLIVALGGDPDAG